MVKMCKTPKPDVLAAILPHLNSKFTAWGILKSDLTWLQKLFGSGLYMSYKSCSILSKG